MNGLRINKAIKLLIMVCLSFFTFHFVEAQNNLKVYDLSFSFDMKQPVNLMDSSSVSNDTMVLSIFFKVDQLDQAGTVNIKVGSAKDDGVIKDVTLNMIENNGHYSLEFNNNVYRFWSNATRFPVEIINTDIDQTKWISVIIFDNLGIIADTQFIQIQ